MGVVVPQSCTSFCKCGRGKNEVMKKLLLTLVGICLTQHSFAQEHGVINNSKSPHVKLRCIDIEECRWTEGFWADKLELCHQVMIPNLGRLMEDPEIIHAYENFLVAAGLKEGEFKGWSFHDGDFYKYVEALCYAYAVTKDKKIEARMDEIIDVIAKAQREDGYIHTQILIGHGIAGFNHASEHPFRGATKPFRVDANHELYNFGHLMTAACIHYRTTGKTNFLDIAKKASDYLYAKFKDPSPELAALDWNPPHYMGLVEMYRTTGDKRYLELAATFVDMLGTGKARTNASTGLDHSQKRTPFREETEAVGHAGHGNYLYCGVADVYAETGDKSLLEALKRVWQNVAFKKMYVTGATGPQHYGLSKNRDLVREAYGKNYELPNICAYNETCANIGNAMWNWRMFLIDGDARHADIVELVFYNSALSGVALDGKHFFYTNPARYLKNHPNVTKDDGVRSPWLSVFCCPPNIIRTIAKMHTYAYCTSDDGVWVNLYGSNVLDTELADGSSLKLTQKTKYPWNGLVEIAVDLAEKKEFSMMLRIPGWASEAKLKVNGQVVETQLPSGSYFELNRTWTTGDVVELDLPMTTQLMVANPGVDSLRNQVAVTRGPLVYCLESVDLPKDVGITEVVIPQDIELTPRFDKHLLSGVTVLEGEAEIIAEEDWSNQLYRRLSPQKPRKERIRLIPYYAWSNRGVSDMTVWLPLKY